MAENRDTHYKEHRQGPSASLEIETRRAGEKRATASSSGDHGPAHFLSRIQGTGVRRHRCGHRLRDRCRPREDVLAETPRIRFQRSASVRLFGRMSGRPHGDARNAHYATGGARRSAYWAICRRTGIVVRVVERWAYSSPELVNG